MRAVAPPPLAAILALAAAVLGSGGAGPLVTVAPAAENLFRVNAGFESTDPENNLWDGVTRDGYLAGAAQSLDALSENGLRPVAMPPSVAFADLNGDNKPDLLTADPGGVFRFYENVGPSVTEPKFTHAETLPLFLSVGTIKRNQDPVGPNWQHGPNGRARFAPRIALADWRRTGNLDMMIGNYLGDLHFLPNVGTRTAPAYRQPRQLDPGLLRANPRTQLAANLLSPAAGAWTGPGRTDLVLGEGTYSANAVRLLENIGSGSSPQFSEERSWTLAYGDGKELLIPCVVDYDGDTRPDLLVADRTGEVSVYLNPGASWKPGQELPFTSKVAFGGSDRLPGLVSLCAGDYNGDGAFDLILGLPNGRLALALNTGGRGQPRFGPPQELKGEKRFAPVSRAVDWDTNSHPENGNLLSYLAVVEAASDPESKPPEGTHCLKAGYWPSLNRVFSPPYEVTLPEQRQFDFRREVRLEAGKTYTLSFKVKGNGVDRLRYELGSRTRDDSAVRIDKLERGVRKTYAADSEASFSSGGEVSVGGGWTQVTKTFTFQTRGRVLPKGYGVSVGLRVEFVLTRPEAAAYFDDFQMVEQGKP